MTDITTFIDLAQAWSDLGSAIQEQVAEVTEAYHNGEDAFEDAVCECNINALGYGITFLEKVARLAEGDVADEAAEIARALEAKGVRPLGW